MVEKLGGWVEFTDKTLAARIDAHTFWRIAGSTDDDFPKPRFRFDHVTFEFKHPEDFKGKFAGTIGRAEICLKWEESGATITGQSPIGDFSIEGNSDIIYVP